MQQERQQWMQLIELLRKRCVDCVCWGGRASNGSWLHATCRLRVAHVVLRCALPIFHRSLLPCVVFCFSKKRCDSLANSLTTFNMTSTAEKAEIHSFVERSVGRLNEADRKLPQIVRLREMLRRGLGVHHAGT